MKIALGSDHAGFAIKNDIKQLLEKEGFECKDFGTFSSESCNYPEFAKNVAEAVARKNAMFGILICGSGIGMSIAANKIKGIRAALCHSKETAELCRKHNDANVLCLGARILDKDTTFEIVNTFLKTEFDGERHQRRISKISELENI